MPVLQKGVAALSNKMPKVITPKAHTIADYATIATVGLLAGLFWRRNQRAAVSAMICAGSQLAATLLTDFPGGVARVISLPAHVNLDFGLAALASALPNFMRFGDEPEAKWFRILGLHVTTVAAMTDTGEIRRQRHRRRAA